MRKTFLLMLLSLLYVGGNLAWGQIAEGDYFIQNVASKAFLNGANSWGTKASATKHGQKMTVAASGDGYTIDSHFSNGGNKHFVNEGNNLYVDGEAVAHTITALGGGVYTVQSPNGDYLVQEGDFVNFKAVELTDDAKWYFLSMEDLFKTLDDATATNPVDATFFVGDPNFSRNNQYFSAWKGGPEKGGWNENMCAEKWNANFDIYQEVKGVPAGKYKLYCQGFYRAGGAPEAAAAATDGTEALNAKLYANTSEAPLQSIVNTATLQTILDNKINEKGGSWSDVTVNGVAYKLPNDKTSASYAFSEGLYGTELDVVVGETGEIRMGFKKETLIGNDWTIFDNFEIYYLGLSDEAIAAAKTAIGNLQTEAMSLVNEPMEEAVAEALRDAVSECGLSANPKPSEIASKTTLINNAIAAAKESIAAYARVKAMLDKADAAVAKYDADGKAAYNVGAINAAYDNGAIPTAECDAKVAEILAAWTAAAKASKSFEAGADVTPLIENNSFETGALAPWTAAKGADTNVFKNAGGYATEGVDGNYLFNTWNGSAMNFDVTQVVAGLPSGIYEVKALYASDAANKANLNAGDATVEVAAGADKAIFVEGTLSDILVATGELKISMTSGAWFKADNFRLTYTRALTDEELAANRLANEEEIAAYNAAVAAIEGKLGFEAGEYAPYNNVEALAALAAAKVDAAKAKAVDVAAATTAIAALEFVANETFVAPVYNGDFALSENGGAPAGWISSNNTLGGDYHARAMVGDDRLAVFNETKSAFYARFDGTNSDKGTLYKYGTTAGYTMPLKAGVDYTLDLDFSGWGQQQNTRFILSDAAGKAAADVTQKPSARVDQNGEVDHISVSFVPSVDGECVLTIQNPGASVNNAIVVSNIDITKTSNETLAMRDYEKWEALCGQLTAAMAGNEEYILPDTRMAIETFQSEDVYPTMIQAALDEANEAGTQYVTPFDWATVEALVADLIANINGVKNGEIPLYTETGVVGDGTANKAMPFFNTTADVEVYANNTIVLKGWDGVKGSDLKVAYNKLDQNGETVLAIAGIEQTVNGEVVSEVNDETEDTYVVLYPQSTVYPMVAVEVAHEMTGLMLGDEEMPAMGTLSLYGHFYKAANVGGEDDNIGVAEPIEAAYMISWPGERILQEDFDVPAGTDLAEYINDNKVLFGEAAILNLEEGDYTMSKAVEIPAGTAVMLAGNGAKLTLSEGASFVMNDGIVLENLTINAAALGNAALIKMGSAPVKQEGQNGQIVENPVSIKNCTINDLPSYIYSDGGKTWIINDFSIENSVIKLNTTDADLKGQALIRANGYGMVSLVIAESTIYNVGEASAAGKYLIQYNNAARADRMGAEMAYVIFRNNTFYNTWSAGGQLANYGGIAGKETTTLTMTDNIFVGMPDIARRFVGNNVGKATVTFANNTYQKADGTYDNASNYDKSGTAIECDPGFENAAEGNFTLSNVSEQAKFQTGDPRWLVEYDAVLAAALADMAKLEAMQADLTQFIAGKDEYITADIRQSIETILGDSWAIAINGAYDDAVEKGTEYVSPIDWALLETQIAWVKEQIEGIMNGTIALYTEAGVVTDGTVNKAMPFFNTPVNVEVYANNTVVLKGWDGVEGSDLKVVYAKVGTLNEADDVEPRTVIIGLEQTVNGEVVSVPQENEDGEVESVTLIPQAGKYAAFDVQLGEEMTSAMIGEGEETGYGVVSLLGAWYPKAAPAEDDELGDNMGVEPAVAALYMVQWPAEPIVLTYTLAELAELPATEEAVEVKVELEGAKVTAAFDMDDYIVAFVEDETAAVQVAAAEIEAGKALTGVVNGTWADYGNGAVLMITENNATAEDADVKTGQEIVEPNELLNPYNVNRLVTVQNSMMCPIVNEEGMLRIGDMVNVYDVFYVLGEEYELPAYITSVTGVLVPMMNSVVLVPRSAADIEGSNQDPDAINNATANNGANGAIYNLSGQKVNANFKGVMIKNGKKVNVK